MQSYGRTGSLIQTKPLPLAMQILTDFIADIYKTRTGNFISSDLLDLIWSITVSIFAVGGMIGGLSGGTIADWCGRFVSLSLSSSVLLPNPLVTVSQEFSPCLCACSSVKK